MDTEQLKKERMKIAYNIMQGLIAHEGLQLLDIPEDVKYAYKVADEILKQGGYSKIEGTL